LRSNTRYKKGKKRGEEEKAKSKRENNVATLDVISENSVPFPHRVFLYEHDITSRSDPS
jgi:hypothetical protein